LFVVECISWWRN